MKDHPAHAYLRYRYELILSAVQRAFEEAQADGDLVGGVSLAKKPSCTPPSRTAYSCSTAMVSARSVRLR